MNKSTILIAEDNTINRQILIKLLGDEYDILETVDGQEAMDILEVKMDDIAALLLDIVMPNKNGYEVLEWLKEKGNTQIPIIVMTGASDNLSEEKALDLGA